MEKKLTAGKKQSETLKIKGYLNHLASFTQAIDSHAHITGRWETPCTDCKIANKRSLIRPKDERSPEVQRNLLGEKQLRLKEDSWKDFSPRKHDWQSQALVQQGERSSGGSMRFFQLTIRANQASSSRSDAGSISTVIHVGQEASHGSGSDDGSISTVFYTPRRESHEFGAGHA
ncbi:hypothetical protein B0T21DRAFT_359767 [Apiosordaria backusii]|uniref:Uncharacterized protein n=1 Tax=Apiosordaria backusii TaxID=314023 RepID=A0AA40ELP0_9PEZI|nr:hypothetical protein B0T21DRAFT_359767 [Apiosordaria backusii]